MGAAPSSEVDPLASGESALRDAQWRQAREHFERAVAATGSAQAWDGLSRAAWWLGDQAATLDARERAYRACTSRRPPRTRATVSSERSWRTPSRRSAA